MWVTSFLEPTNYGWAFMQVFLGTCLTGLGVSAMVFARLLVLPPEGFVIAVMHRFGGSFGTIRTSVDVFLVAISVSMSLFFFGTIYGVREGTLISALFAGRMANGFLRRWGKLFPNHRPID